MDIFFGVDGFVYHGWEASFAKVVWYGWSLHTCGKAVGVVVVVV